MSKWIEVVDLLKRNRFIGCFHRHSHQDIVQHVLNDSWQDLAFFEIVELVGREELVVHICLNVENYAQVAGSRGEMGMSLL